MEPCFDEKEAKAVCEYIHSGGWLTEYTKTAELEGMIASYLDVKHCIMMPNCTLALYAVLKVLGVGCGDMVLVPAMTMVATVNAVCMTGAHPLFVDIDPKTLCMDLDRVSNRGHRRGTRALIYVSLNGRCGDMDKVREFCETFNLWCIEDAAQSLGSRWHGKHLGTFGDIGCFSLSTQKIITTGNGGFCVTGSDEYAEKLRLFKNFGRSSGGNDDYQTFGINLKYTDLQAVVGIEQMKKLDERIERKVEMGKLYSRWLKSAKSLLHQDGGIPWFYDVMIEDRDKLSAHLLECGIRTRPIYPALHRTPAYRGGYSHYKLPVAEDIANRGLWLPSSVKLTDDDVITICDEIERFYCA
jgi:perosamine synthetase